MRSHTFSERKRLRARVAVSHAAKEAVMAALTKLKANCSQDNQAALGFRGERCLTLVMTTRPETFSVTFHWIVTLLPVEIACRAMRNRATMATMATAGQSREGRLAQKSLVGVGGCDG